MDAPPPPTWPGAAGAPTGAPADPTGAAADPTGAAPDAGGYLPPPPFAPPAYRVAALNEAWVYPRSSYPPAAGHAAAGHAAAGHPAPEHLAVPPLWAAADHRAAPTARRVSAAIAALVATALVAIGAVLLVAPSPHHVHSLVLPATVDGYVRTSTLDGSRLRGLFTGTPAGTPVDAIASARAAVYSQGGRGGVGMLFIGLDAAHSSTVAADLSGADDAGLADGVLAGLGAAAGAVTVAPGPQGGAVRCGAGQLSGLAAGVGVWADSDTMGIVVVIDTATGAPGLADTVSLTQDVRAAAEH